MSKKKFTDKICPDCGVGAVTEDDICQDCKRNIYEDDDYCDNPACLVHGCDGSCRQ